jgi:hypothetical protein
MKEKRGRRGNQEGSLTLRQDGRCMARLSHEGRRISAYGRTKEEARLKLRALQRKQDQGIAMISSRTPLKAYLTDWLESIKHRVAQKTFADYSDLVRCHIAPQLGHVALGKLTPAHISAAWSDLLRGEVSPSA